ncbi:Nucleoid occlusion protein [subsurface metagenome]
MELSIEKIKLPANMMRQMVSERGMEDLVGSIKEIGIVNAITVRKKGEEHELVAGLRRYMAADILKMEKVPVKVVRASDERAEKIKMAENKAREDIDPIDEGAYFEKLMEMFGWKQKELAEKFRVSESYVSQRISAVNWPEILKIPVQEGLLTFSVAREFAGIKYPEELDRVIKQAVESGVTPAVAARWRHNINRGDFSMEGLEGQEAQVAASGAMADLLYSCQICGGPGKEIGYKIVRVCNICIGVIKVGQEEGVFKKGEVKKGATQGEEV